MTREDLIEQAASAFENKHAEETVSQYNCFINGCEWADSNRWVRVEDGLPDTNNLCIVCLDGEEFEFDHFVTIAGKDRFTYPNVTHWQFVTLPSPPKAEQ